MTIARMKRLRLVAGWMASLCALAASLALVAPAAAESIDPSTLPAYDGVDFPDISGPTDPEEFSWRVELGQRQRLQQVDERTAAVVYEDGVTSYTITAEPAHDATGARVPTTLAVSEGDVLTFVVHHRAGNPAAGGAPFAYPITAGEGWEGEFHTEIVSGPPDEAELAAQRAREADSAVPPPAPPDPPAVASACTVPYLRGLNLRAAKSRLRAADCVAGRVYLLGGATATKGKVVKQFRATGMELAAGAPVALKLAGRQG